MPGGIGTVIKALYTNLIGTSSPNIVSIKADIEELVACTKGGLLGTRVFRAASACPQNVWLPIFTVTGGPVLMTMLVGERTILQAGGASNLDIQIDPTAGGAISFCAVTVVSDDPVGTFCTFTGTPADDCFAALAVPGGMAGGLLATGINTLGWIVPIGDVEWRESAVAGTGSVQWTMFYIPLSAAATVAAA